MTLLFAVTAAFAAVAEPTTGAGWFDMVVRYLVAGLVGWVASSVQFSKKLKAHEDKVIATIDDQTKKTNDRIDKANANVEEVKRELAKVAAEMWGPHGESGLHKDVGVLKEQMARQAVTLAEILTTVRMLAEKSH